MAATRSFPLDALRALAAQLIVLHHLSVYGPIAEAMHGLSPAISGWFHDYGRMAVQIFLVLGGYLSARALSAHEPSLHRSAPALLAQRYGRLAPPFLVAVGLTLAASWLVAPLLPALVPEQVTLTQLLAHVLLLHDVLGQEALTVGAWYVAIDFQLFALLLALMWGLRRLGLSQTWRQGLAPVLVGALVTASLLYFNRHSAQDAYAPYFFGAYGLGALLFWWQGWPTRLRWLSLGLLVSLLLLALAMQFRERLLVATATGAVLMLWRQGPGPAWWADRVQGLARDAYALFLVHFPVILLVNAVYAHHAASPAPMPGALAPAALLLAWGLANLAAVPFHRWVEAPLLRWRPAVIRAGTAAPGP
jgi:peptidoglycan/LPS O-acetylase OafA/YrhL